MKKAAIFLIICVCSIQVNLAQVGIGITLPEAMLDVVSSDSGILIPRVTLTQIDVAAPITSPTNSELVYNDTATPGGSPILEHLRVTKGFYHWDTSDSKWVRIADDVKVPSFNATYNQTTELAVTGSMTNIPGMSNSFVAPYDGTYQIIFTGGYGVGEVTTTSHNYEVGLGEATFRLVVDNGSVTNTDRVVGSRSYYFNATSVQHNNLIQWVTIYENVYLNSGQTCTVNAQIEEFASTNLSTSSLVGKNNGGVSDPKYRSQIQVILISN